MIAVLTLGAGASYAKGIDIAYVGPTQLYAACQKAGGDFSTAPGTYGCTKQNCDGKGGMCSVACGTVDKKCVGATPGHLVANVTLNEFLTAAHIAPLVTSAEDTGGSAQGGPGGGGSSGPTHPAHPGDLFGGSVHVGPSLGSGIQ
jgi:hypothetical protein